MHLDRGRVERERLDLDPHDLLRLQLLEYLIENPVLGPAIHPRVDRVPAAETLRQTAPFAALLSDILNAFSTCRLLKRTFPRCTGNASLIRSYCSSVISILSRD